MFFGRLEELEQLQSLRFKKVASLVCIQGRRRIGKSSLIDKFSKTFKKFVVIQGLAPNPEIKNQNQLDHFAQRLSQVLKCGPYKFTDWTEAFSALSRETQKGEILILLDEISWMGKHDPLFAGKLKDAWDLEFKKNPKLILVLCGSVSTWIEDNILQNTNFVGRVSLQINLKELSLPEINQFWTSQNFNMGTLEKMLILSVTGGVPKYLEEVLSKKNAQDNLLNLCFNPNGSLFNEFDKIFSDIFLGKKNSLEKIVKALVDKKLAPVEIAKKTKSVQSGELTHLIKILEVSGFLSRDYYYKPNGEQSKLCQVRLSDNFLRFYLKYIAPLKDKITHQQIKMTSLYGLKNFDSILGLQFENLILNNRNILYKILKLEANHIVSSAPYYQKRPKACQVDLLIHTHLDVFYLCELKCKKMIDASIINEVEKKMKAIALPKRSSLKPILIYEGEIYPSHLEKIENYFFKVVPFADFLTSI
jgi:AAA+ ATPase superfamily predicted ATPase